MMTGKEALIALANGEEVEFKDGMNKWENIKYHMNLDLSMFLTAPDWMKFRLKPRTITINRIEVPAPFEPKEGDEYWVLFESHYSNDGYKLILADHPQQKIAYGAWRTESEIKQVVSALRSIFK